MVEVEGSEPQEEKFHLHSRLSNRPLGNGWNAAAAGDHAGMEDPQVRRTCNKGCASSGWHVLWSVEG